MQSEKQSLYFQKQESLYKILEDLKDKYNRKRGSLDNIDSEMNKCQEEVFSCEKRIKIIIKAQNLLNQISNELRASSLLAIEGIVSSALKEVFTDKNAEFKMEMNLDTSKPSLETYVKERGNDFDILEGRGLGMADLISVALRVCIKSMYKPKIQFPIILDESFKFLHGEKENGSYPINAFKFLKKITAGLDQQVIFVTGIESKKFVDVADNILQIKQEDGISRIVENE